MNPFFIILIIIAALVCIYFITGRILFECTFRRAKQKSSSKAKNSAVLPPLEEAFDFLSEFDAHADFLAGEREWFMSQNITDFSVTSFDGLTLRAKYLPAESPVGTVVLFHGYRSTGLEDYSPVLRKYHSWGMNILLPSQRACGDSDGKYITFGINERLDCQKWCEFLYEKDPETPVMLVGLSLGCSTVLMASGLELPENVRGVIGDCGFTSPKEQLSYVIHRFFKMPDFPVANMLAFWAKHLGKFEMDGYSTIEAMKTNSLPVMFVHGGADKFVPCEMSKRCYDACTAPKSLLISPEAGHAISYFKSTEEYETRVLEFINNYVRR